MHRKDFMKSRPWAPWGIGVVAAVAAWPLHAQTATPGTAAQPAGAAMQVEAVRSTPTQAPVNATANQLVPASAPMGSEGSVAPLNSLGAVDADYRISPNDLMEFNVFGVPDMKRDVRVNASGQVSLPLIGPVQVAGLTSQAAEQLIATKYREKYLRDPQVSLFIKEFTTQRVAIEGAVIKPGIYPVSGQLTLLRALALSGGFAPYANINQIVVYRSGARGEREQFTYDLDKVRAGQEKDPDIRSDDVIVVQRNASRAALKDSLFRDILDTLNPFR